MAGNDVEITVESRFLHEQANATISGTTRLYGLGGALEDISGTGRRGAALSRCKPSAGCWNEGSISSALRKSATAPALSASRSRISPRVEKSARRTRIERDGAIGVGEGFDILAGEVMRPGAIVIGECRIRRELDGVRVVGDGVGKSQPLALGVAAVDVGVGRARIELDGRIEIGDGALVLALGEPGAAPVVVGRGRRIELDRLIVIGNSAIEIAFVRQAMPRL